MSIEDTVQDTSEDVTAFVLSVGARVQKVREFRGLTRRELGLAIGLTGNSANTGVYAIEVSGNALRIDTIFKVATALDVTPGFLLDGGEMKVFRTESF